MRHRLPLIALVAFSSFLIGIVWLANHGRGFWGFLHRIPYGDKLGHVGLVGLFAYLFNLTLGNRRCPAPLQHVLMGSGLVVAIMTLEELSQKFLPHRSPDFIDWVANLTGAALAQIAAILTFRRATPTGRRPRRRDA